MRVNGVAYRTVWMEGSVVKMIDQRRLPFRFEVVSLPTCYQTAQAIRDMTVRGAGAIGVAAGYAMAQAALAAPANDYDAAMAKAADVVRATRPTARDLFYAVEQVLHGIESVHGIDEKRRQAVQTARTLSDQSAQAGERIGEIGQQLFRNDSTEISLREISQSGNPTGSERNHPKGPLTSEMSRGGMAGSSSDEITVLTHCNAGWLAFADWGSALAPVYHAHRRGRRIRVYATETRPRSQGAKLTAWELTQEGVPCTLIPDTAAGSAMRQGLIDLILVGADRIAANGDVANKIGTYTLAVLARTHQIPFYVAAPTSTIDMNCQDGRSIPIEERSEEEVLWITGCGEDGQAVRTRIAADGVSARNWAFDVTPSKYLTGLLTERGLISPEPAAIRGLMRASPALIGGMPT